MKKRAKFLIIQPKDAFEMESQKYCQDGFVLFHAHVLKFCIILNFG